MTKSTHHSFVVVEGTFDKQSFQKPVQLNVCSSGDLTPPFQWIMKLEAALVDLKLCYVKSKNGHILINVINFKLRLINFVYYLRHPVSMSLMFITNADVELLQ